MAEPALSQRLD